MKKICKKLLITGIIIFSSLTSYSFSETYSCSYFYGKKTYPIQFVRQNNIFLENNNLRDNTSHRILYEDNTNLILGLVTYVRNDQDNRRGLQVTFIDKISLMYTSGIINNPNYGKNSSIVKGNCLVTN